ncbi:unnamed protein product [Triticum turgidum subsp. durum]|uniref:Hexosyltransferase n=1 Tax=Triticum turgidum subsp. durum TaxID=4567 RepID=A0A9R0Q1V8_TRITD|nr:unnamed protein product [Triticum turgidum subsp. durum]
MRVQLALRVRASTLKGSRERAPRATHLREGSNNSSLRRATRSTRHGPPSRVVRVHTVRADQRTRSTPERPPQPYNDGGPNRALWSTRHGPPSLVGWLDASPKGPHGTPSWNGRLEMLFMCEEPRKTHRDQIIRTHQPPKTLGPSSPKSHLMPLHHPKHRHHHDEDVLPYHRSDDEAKPRRPYVPSSFPSSPASAASPHRFLLPFAVVCLLLAVASLSFAVSVSRRPVPLQSPPDSVAFRCGRAEDSLRSFLASSGNYSAGDREKVLAVVGVHTELGSAARRAALRATWFPPNPEGVVSLLLEKLIPSCGSHKTMPIVAFTCIALRSFD